MIAWTYDRALKWHTAPVGNGAGFIFVYLTTAGDYAISAMHSGDPSGGDVLYEDNLRAAKKRAVAMIENGMWKDLTL